jgi:hypothetical protein
VGEGKPGKEGMEVMSDVFLFSTFEGPKIRCGITCVVNYTQSNKISNSFGKFFMPYDRFSRNGLYAG